MTANSPEPRPDSSASTSDPWTTRRLLDQMRTLFVNREVDSPRVVAEMLLAEVLRCDRMRLYMEVDRPASPEELITLRSLVARAANHEPVQYLLGEWSFFGRTFEVNPSTLIPRPSTEMLVEHALQWARQHRAATSMPVERPAGIVDDSQIQTQPMRLADIGTGTGCMAVCLAAQLPMAQVVATDIVPEALELARANASRHGVLGSVDFREGDGLGPLRGDELFDVICSNPPYISDSEWDDVLPNVRDHEPQSALRAGADGLSVIRPLIAEAWKLLQPGGLLLIEIAHSQREVVLELAAAVPQLTDVQVLKDHEGFWRMLRAQRASAS